MDMVLDPSSRNRSLAWRLFLSVLVLALGALGARLEAAPQSDSFHQFMDTSNRIFAGQGDSFLLYTQLRQQYASLPEEQRRQAGQIISMVDAMYGRYVDASAHFHETFPGFGEMLECLPDGMPKDAKSALIGLASHSRVLIFNESHSMVGTRAFLIEMLPSLRKLGYNKLALEALYPSHNEPAVEERLMKRGYPLDSSKEGFYLREPVYGELIRTALKQGFTLVQYESEATATEVREADQARVLARQIQGSPKEKMIVLAGYSHAWKSGGWMAERLNRALSGGVASIDQTSGLGGCKKSRGQSSEPIVLEYPSGQLWASRDDVDVTLIRNTPNDRDNNASWLSLGKLRRRILMPENLCGTHRPCLLEAISHREETSAVPADRYVLFGQAERPYLFLEPGEYLLRIRTVDTEKSHELFVHPSGDFSITSTSSDMSSTSPRFQ
jgi:hypothetical protein